MLKNRRNAQATFVFKKRKKKKLRTGLEPASTRQEKKIHVQSRYHLSQEELEERGNVVICLLDAVIIHYALFNLALVTSF